MKIELEIKDPPGPPKHHEWEVRGYNHKSDIPGTYARACPTLGWGIADYYAPPGNSGCFYLEAVRTHHDDGVPIEITPLPTMPAHVERVEYHGQYMRPGDMGSADNYITYYIGDTEWSRISHIKAKFTDKKPANSALYYARVFYKKEKPAPTEPLPERDGWRFDVSKGKWGMTREEMVETSCDGITGWISQLSIYHRQSPDKSWNYGLKDTFYIPAYKVAKKTELSDLLGEDGQMTAYLLSEGGSVFPFVLCQITEGNWTETFEGKETSWKKRRWSHSPFTPYADANPFVF